MKSGGDTANKICQGLTGDKNAYCEVEVEEQCIEQLGQLCSELHPDVSGKAGAPYRECASDTETPWTVPQDESLAASLQNQSKWFSIELPELVSKVYTAFSLQECGMIIADIVKHYGVPEDFDPFTTADPFVKVTNQNVNEFLDLGQKVILVIGRADDPATVELQRQIYAENQDDVRLIFIERPETMNNAFKKLMKKLGLFTFNSNKKKWNYGIFDQENPSAQAFVREAGAQNKTDWSYHINVEEAEEFVPEEEAVSYDSLSDLAAKKKEEFLLAQQAKKKQAFFLAQQAKKKKEQFLHEQAVKKKEEFIKTHQGSPDMVITEAEVESEGTSDVVASTTPVVTEVHPDLEAPDVYSPKVEAIVGAESKLQSDPMAGYARTLTPLNFAKFFSQKSRPVIVIVADQELHQMFTIGQIQDEQQALPSSQQAFIAVLDISNAATRGILWSKLTGLKQNPQAMIDKDHIKSFGVFTYNKGALSAYSGLVDVGDAPKAPAISELQKQFYFSNIKKDKIKFPMTVYAVNDPTHPDFSSLNFSEHEGTVYYVDLSDPQSCAFASNYLGIPPLTDNYVYQEWTFEEDNLTEHAYFTNLQLSGGKLHSISDLVNGTALTSDPNEFVYVDIVNFDRYFGEETRSDSIVVVGDPLDDETQALMQTISAEKADLGHDLDLIMIPHTGDFGAASILKSLGINKTKVTNHPQVYQVSWNDAGTPVAKKYITHGIETVAANNEVWSKTVINSNKNVLLIIGDTNASWDAGIAHATTALRQQIADEMTDGSMTVEGKKVTDVVFIDHTMMEMIFASELENPQANTIPYNYAFNPNLPQMYVITGSAGNRESMAVSGADLGLPIGGWEPDARPEEPIIENVVKKKKAEDAKKYAEMMENLESMGITEGKVVSTQEGMCINIGDPFQEITPMSSAWQVANKEFIVVIGSSGDGNVQKMKNKLAKLKSDCQEDRKLLFVDTSLPPSGTDEYSTKVAWLSKLFTKVFGLESVSGKSMVLECKAKLTGDGFKCSEYHFSK